MAAAVIPLSVADLAAELARSGPAELTGGGNPQALITGVTADSRRVDGGTLFVALPGEKVDGHAFVSSASAAGAVAALTARPVPGAGLCLITPDPLAALGRLARLIVDRRTPHGLRVVGITGSQGKTSTKDLLAQVLERVAPTVAPIGNLNNELGLPLTVTRVDLDTRFLVAEMGARGIGHIAYLCGIAPPRVGVLLNVGHAHVGEFGSQAAIAIAKSELIAALPADGVAVLNFDDPLVWARRTVTAAPVVACSVRGRPEWPAAVWAGGATADRFGRYRFRLHIDLEATLGRGGSEAEVDVHLRTVGAHQVGNAVAAAAAALALGLAPADVADGLSAAGARSRWRMELTERRDGVAVLNDSYNANPDSMRAALDALAQLTASSGGRGWALLGDMLELGASAGADHRALGAEAARRGVHRLLVIGEHAEQVAEGATAAGLDADRIAVLPDRAAMVAATRGQLRAGDVVLVKASRGLALDTVAEGILAEHIQAEQIQAEQIQAGQTRAGETVPRPASGVEAAP